LQLKNAIEHANVLLRELDDACQALLRANEPVLRAIAERLLESETVSGDTVEQLIREHAAASSPSMHLAQEPAAA
jgi:cell division protease FtsH